MKIDLIHYSSPPVVGGVESVLACHARLMADAGHSVRVITGRGAIFDPRIPVLLLDRIGSRHTEIIEMKRALDLGQVPEQFGILRNQLVAEIEKIVSGTDLLIAHNVCSLNKNLPLTAALHELARRKGAPRLILWHHDLAWTTPRYRQELYEGYPWDLLRTDWAEAAQVVVSELRRRELCGLLGVPAQRVRVIPNGLDMRQFLKLDELTVGLIQRMRTDLADPLLLLPVRITPRKNIELALRVLAALRPRFPRGMLVVTGPLGPHNPDNVKYFHQLVTLREELGLLGSAYFLAELVEDYLPDSVIADFYRLADALILPSREEGFGIPVLEAGLAGIPIFCSDIPPMQELAGKNALYFNPDADPGDVAAMIGNCLAESSIYQMRLKVRTRYSWERVYSEQIQPLLVEWTAVS